jgi:PmbA protein
MSDVGASVESRRGDLEAAAREAVAGAMARGATGARAAAAASRSVSITYRQGRPERVAESAQRRLTVWLFVDGRYATCETNHLDEDALARFLDASVALARAVEPDAHRALPDPALYAALDPARAPALELVDPALAALANEERHRYAAALEAAVRDRAAPGELETVEARYADSEELTVLVDSGGFRGVHHETQLWGAADVSIRDADDRRPSGWGVASARSRALLAPPEAVAEEALAVARARVGSAPIATARLPLVVDSRAAGRLLRALLAALDGRAVQQRASFLEGRRGQAVGSARLDVVDDPFVPRGLGSRLFDGEGLPARRRHLFERGTLRTFFLDTYYARKLAETPTSGGSSNVVVTPGGRSLAELVRGVDRGLLVRGFLGGSSNSTTGDFSFGVHGTLIEGGALGRAVAEVNVAGNHGDLWPRLVEVGDDPYPHATVRSPSLVFDEVQVSGR